MADQYVDVHENPHTHRFHYSVDGNEIGPFDTFNDAQNHMIERKNNTSVYTSAPPLADDAASIAKRWKEIADAEKIA